MSNLFKFVYFEFFVVIKEYCFTNVLFTFEDLLTLAFWGTNPREPKAVKSFTCSTYALTLLTLLVKIAM